MSVLTAHTLLDEALKANKAVIVNDNGTLRLKQAENPTMDYVDAGYKPVSFKDYTDRLLADNHLLEVSNGAGQRIAVPTPPPAGGAQITSAFQSAMEAAKLS